MSKMGSHDPFGHLKHKLWPKVKAESQIGSLTLDHQKSRITLISLCAGGMRYTIGKLLTRAKTLFSTSSQLEVCTQSYEAPKLRES